MMISIGGLSFAGDCALAQALEPAKRAPIGMEMREGRVRFSLAAVNARVTAVSAAQAKGDRAAVAEWSQLLQDWRVWLPQHFEMQENELAAMRRMNRETVMKMQKELQAAGRGRRTIRILAADAATANYGQGNMAMAKAAPCKEVVVDIGYNFKEAVLNMKWTFKF
jgi:hypothetical protein